MTAPDLGFVPYPLDRADHLRKDAGALAELRARPDSRLVAFWRGKPLAVTREGRRAPGLLAANAEGLVEDEVVFLGLGGEAGVFAAAFPNAFDPADLLAGLAGGAFEDLRGLAMQLPAGEGALLGAARAVLDWHRRHRFCSNCGAGSAFAFGGWKRLCAACGTEHFPRVDPVVIMAIARGDALLLGRQASWPPGVVSCLAGYIEPGETFEAAARREAFEEAGMRLGAVRYLMSQPWPFPSSLMVGLVCETADTAIRVNHDELESALWVARADLPALLAGRHPSLRAPPPLAIAHHLIRVWADGG